MATPPPPPSSPKRRALHERTPSDRNRLQIRLVPYSPPRLSSDGSPPSSATCPPSPLALFAQKDDHPSNPPRHSVHQEGNVDHHASRPAARVSSSRALSTSPVDSGQGKQLAETALTGAVSPSPSTGSHVAAANWTALSLSSPSPCISPSPSPTRLLSHATPSSSPSLAAQHRLKKVISVHSDKTFSLVAQSGSASSATDSLRSPRYSSTVQSASYDLSSSDLLGEDRPSSPLTPLPELSSQDNSPISKYPGTASDSPWNYRFVGGVRKVHYSVSNPVKAVGDTPSSSPSPSTQAACSSSRVVHDPVVDPATRARSSLSSSRSPSTLSERSNFKTYTLAPGTGPGSSGPIPGSSEDDISSQSISDPECANIDILGESSSDHSADDQQRPQTVGSESNYILHGGHSPFSASSAVTDRLRSEYSRESLLVPPLRTIRATLPDRDIHKPTRSRDSIRTASLSSVSTVVIEEATRSLFAGPVAIHMLGDAPLNSSSKSFRAGIQSQGRTPQNHHWSSALSTVFSESEGSSSRPSRSLSPFGVLDGPSGGDPSHISGVFDAGASGSTSAIDEQIDSPREAVSGLGVREQGGNTVRLIRNQDEHGDGLADLEVLNGPFRSRLHSFLSSHSSDRNLRSSSSSHSNGLITRSSIPTWARVYYGSGERRFLAAQPSSESLYSIYEEDVQLDVSLSRSPSADRLPVTVQNPRRRPRDQPRLDNRCPASQEDSIQTMPCQPLPVARVVKKQTSSLWSPHLHRDRRFRRHTIWQPPSTIWSVDEPVSWTRNMQPILFVLGFIFPFAWMVAAFLPLPSQAHFDMAEARQSTGHLDPRPEAGRSVHAVHARRYCRARWWRSLNRAMSIVGLFVVGAIVALIVTGVKQQWKS